MAVKYYFERIGGEITSRKTIRVCRLFAIIDDSYYWAVEWTDQADKTKSVLNDFNAGFMSQTVKDACANLNEIQPDELVAKFGAMAHYIERSVIAFKMYILSINPGDRVHNIVWQIDRD